MSSSAESLPSNAHLAARIILIERRLRIQAVLITVLLVVDLFAWMRS
jgi:hypothetical protein